MAQFIAAFRDEIRRLARKEARTLLRATKRAAMQHRREIAALKRSVHTLEKRLATVEGAERKRMPPLPAKAIEGARFSSGWLKSHRKRIKFNAESYGKLLGVSAQSVYLWERGVAKPQKSKLAALVAVRGMGQREAKQRLTLLNGKT